MFTKTLFEEYQGHHYRLDDKSKTDSDQVEHVFLDSGLNKQQA